MANVKAVHVLSVVNAAAALISLDLAAQVRLSAAFNAFELLDYFPCTGVKKQACEARKCLRMSRQREEADPMPKKRAKGGTGADWEQPTLLQDMGILGEVHASPIQSFSACLFTRGTPRITKC